VVDTLHRAETAGTAPRREDRTSLLSGHLLEQPSEQQSLAEAATKQELPESTKQSTIETQRATAKAQRAAAEETAHPYLQTIAFIYTGQKSEGIAEDQSGQSTSQPSDTTASQKETDK